ncbi:MAG: thiamine diphosphokinase [Treponema sp.]|nr:thiamine diphosphokinase [Treponema sp.]
MVSQKTRCLIISGGKENQIKGKFSEGFENVFVIACDKGCEYAVKQNIPCDYVCGDFDSYKGPVPVGAEVLPTHKDDTDTMHGIKKALEMGFREIILTCAGGGRTDHFISNVQALVYAKEEGSLSSGVEVSLFDDENEIRILKNESAEFLRRKGFSFSVLSWSDKAEGVTISGAEYEVSDVCLTNSFPLGQSNEWKSDAITVSVKKGVLLVIMSKVFL